MQSITTMFIWSIALLMLSFLTPIARSDLSRNFVLFRLHSILFCVFHISWDDILDDDNGIVFAQRMVLHSFLHLFSVSCFNLKDWILLLLHVNTYSDTKYRIFMQYVRASLSGRNEVKRNRRLKTIATKSNTSQIDVFVTVATPISCTLLSILLFSLWICLHSKSFSVLA